jgi:flagellar basal-body rod protein FlgB
VLDDLATVTLAQALTGLSARERVSANNIANLDTPNFRAGTVSFEDSLKSAVAQGDPGQATITQGFSTDAPGINGNNVSLDTEIVNDEKTQMQFSLVSNALSAKFALIESAIKG